MHEKTNVKYKKRVLLHLKRFNAKWFHALCTYLCVTTKETGSCTN